MDVENPENQPAESALNDCRDDVAFHRSTGNGGEHVKESASLIRVQGNSSFDAIGEFVTVTQQKKQQVQYNAKIDRQIEGVLADRDSLAGKKLTALHQVGRQFILRGTEIAHAKALQQVGY